GRGAYHRSVARWISANAFSSRRSTIMSARVLVLGAAGRLGHAAAEAFRDAGWSVASLVRPGNASRAPADTEIVEIHALDHAAVAKTAGGADVILHALNPPYTDWSRLALPLAYSALTACHVWRLGCGEFVGGDDDATVLQERLRNAFLFRFVI